MMLIPLVIASKNIHKIREYKELLKGLNKFDVLSLLDFPEYVPPKEKGKSFQENAEIKAVFAAKTLHKLVLSDDSGLVIPKLDGEPGIYSARYAGENASDMDNRKKLLSKMDQLEDDDRNGYFECCISLAREDGLIASFCATCEGRVKEKECGGSGFGYDPLFIKSGYSKTFAELDSFLKNKISHRGKAFSRMLTTLESLY